MATINLIETRVRNNTLVESAKPSIGWLYGLKLHLIVNDRDEFLTFYLSPGNVDDRHPLLSLRLFSQLFGDRGYISRTLFEALLEDSV